MGSSRTVALRRSTRAAAKATFAIRFVASRMTVLFPVVRARARTGGVFLSSFSSSMFFGGFITSARVVVFLDYQNVYKGAREEFGLLGDPSRHGQIDPLNLSELIVAKHPDDTRLEAVRVYRGRPDSTKQPEAYAANMRQAAAQERRGRGLVTFVTRALRYPEDWPRSPAQEKGIDVALAVDFVMMAARDQYDVGVLMSTDTDLVPALEAVAGLPTYPHPRCEVAAWTLPGSHSRRLHVRGRRLWCHQLGPDDFDAVRDDTDYNAV
jgi:hypothetical protein